MYNASSLASASSTSIVNLTAPDTVSSGGQTVYALKTNSGISGSGTLTITSGGLIVAPSADTTISAPLTFTNEGFIYACNGCNLTLSGTITSAHGLNLNAPNNTTNTPSYFNLNGNNSTTLGGVITVNAGVLQPLTLQSLGTATLALNGGAFEPSAWGGAIGRTVYLALPVEASATTATT